jgi:CorA-like Mg2+ transporter protein
MLGALISLSALMIVDKPPKEFLEAYKGGLVRKTIENRPYQGGYPDFIPYDSLDVMRQKPAPSRTSIFDDLYHYFQNHSEVLEINKNPLSVDLFLRKIVASYYMILSEYCRGLLSHIEWQTSRQERLETLTVPWLQQRWDSIHNFHRRCEDYTYAIDAIIRNLELNRDAGLNKDWKTSAADFKDIQARFGEIRRKSEGLIASFSGLSGIISSRESLREAQTVGYLTLLGMIFLPLSFASGLFSMSDDYLPGAKNFGTYWAVSIPIIAAIFVIPFVMRLGYETHTRES